MYTGAQRRNLVEACQRLLRRFLSKVPPLMHYVNVLGSLTEWLLTVCMLICLSLFPYEFQVMAKSCTFLYYYSSDTFQR